MSRAANLDRAVTRTRRHQPRTHTVYDDEAVWYRRIERQAALAADLGERKQLVIAATMAGRPWGTQ